MNSDRSKKQFLTDSGIPVKGVYTQEDISGHDPVQDLGAPGEVPFTRGVYSGMYRKMPWRIRQLTGFGSLEDQRERIRYALKVGDPTITVICDLSTANLWDVDHPEVVARKDDVGLYGAPMSSLRDWEFLLEGIEQDKVYGGVMGTVQHQPFTFGSYFALAENRGIPLNRLGGTGMQDMCTCYIACPWPDQVAPSSALRFVGDMTEFCVKNAPHMTPTSFSGYNIRECGITAYQEIATVLACASTYIDEILGRGNLTIDEFAHSMASAHLSCDRDFFEEIAKFRAIRRMWSRLLTEKYHAKDPHSLKFRIHVQTSGASLTYQQPLNNLVRVSYQVLAAALGGVQSMNSDGYDEAYCTPSEQAALLAIRTQQIAQNEINISNVADPLGGSYYVEHLTNEIEERAWDYLKRIDQQGGFLSALESGWFHGEYLAGMIDQEQKVASGEKKIVGVNCFQMEGEPFKISPLQLSPGIWDRAMANLESNRAERDSKKADQALGELRRSLETNENIMRPMIDAMKAYVTVGELGHLFRDIYPVWNPPE